MRFPGPDGGIQREAVAVKQSGDDGGESAAVQHLNAIDAVGLSRMS